MKRFFTLGALVLFAGCQSPGSARFVTRHADNGVVAISSNTSADRDKGLALIARHVGGQFIIEKEEVVMLGDDSHRHRDRAVQPQSNPLATKSAQDILALETKPRSEHRIHYRRSLPATSVSSEAPVIQPASAALPAAPVGVPTLPMALPISPSMSSIPAAPLPPTRVTTPPTGVKSFLPLTCEGCQGK